ncbi:hypothetical protein BVI434_570009 [Burkholderia vietnamiensis]|nr:hypothetical protein BVI434_570009 [Burkholderia vietnamiensis]
MRIAALTHRLCWQACGYPAQAFAKPLIGRRFARHVNVSARPSRRTGDPVRPLTDARATRQDHTTPRAQVTRRRHGPAAPPAFDNDTSLRGRPWNISTQGKCWSRSCSSRSSSIRTCASCGARATRAGGS